MNNIVNHKPLYEALNEVLLQDNIKDVSYIFIQVDGCETEVKPNEVIQFVHHRPRTSEANVSKIEVKGTVISIYASTR